MQKAAAKVNPVATSKGNESQRKSGVEQSRVFAEQQRQPGPPYADEGIVHTPPSAETAAVINLGQGRAELSEGSASVDGVGAGLGLSAGDIGMTDSWASRIGSEGSFGRMTSSEVGGSFGRTASCGSCEEGEEATMKRFQTFLLCLEADVEEERGVDDGRQKEVGADAAMQWLLQAKLRKRAPPKLMTVQHIVTPLKVKEQVRDRQLPGDAVEPARGTGGGGSWFDAVAAVLRGSKDNREEGAEEGAEGGGEGWMERIRQRFAESVNVAEEKSKEVLQPVLERGGHVDVWVDENITRPATETAEKVGVVVKEGVKEVGDKGVGVWIDERVGKPLREGYRDVEERSKSVIQTVDEKGREIVERGKDFVQNAEVRSKEIVETVEERGKEIVESVEEVGKSIQEKGFAPVVTEVMQRVGSGLVSTTREQGLAIVDEIEIEVMPGRDAVEGEFPDEVTHARCPSPCPFFPCLPSFRG